VGTVWIAVASRGRAPAATRLPIAGDRAAVRRAAALHALRLLSACVQEG
jgi:nicotinamide mononucleotide (NMN) deamidase PncC